MYFRNYGLRNAWMSRKLGFRRTFDSQHGKSTTDDKYSLRNSENLPRPFQMHLSKKQKIGNLKSTSNFEHFEKIDELQWLCISEIMDWEGSG